MSTSARCSLALMLVSGCGAVAIDGDADRRASPEGAAPPDARSSPVPAGELVAARSLGSATLSLYRDAEGLGTLWLAPPGGDARPVPCDRLVGAWALWVDDVDTDGHPEAIVALRKPARFDPRIDNRLHVYGFEHGRCVPAWRGTRLAGRFDALRTDPDAPGTLVVSERLGIDRRRVARYRWTGFGYAVEAVLWQGAGEPPPDLTRDLVVAPHRESTPS